MSVPLKIGQIWEFRSGGHTIDVYLVTDLNADGSVHMVDLRSLEHFSCVRVSYSADPDHGWKVLS